VRLFSTEYRPLTIDQFQLCRTVFVRQDTWQTPPVFGALDLVDFLDQSPGSESYPAARWGIRLFIRTDNLSFYIGTFPVYPTQTRFNDAVEDTDRTLSDFTELTLRSTSSAELPDDLCSGRAVDGHGFDRQTRTIEGELCGREGQCDHNGKGDN